MEYEQSVARHYAHGALEQVILGALATAGKDLDHLTPADLAPVENGSGDLSFPVPWALIDNLERGLIAPTVIISRAV